MGFTRPPLGRLNPAAQAKAQQVVEKLQAMRLSKVASIVREGVEETLSARRGERIFGPPLLRHRFICGVGMILGKFMPPHRGHQYLIDFARRYCDRLYVLVCTLEREPIDGSLRYHWMQELFPQPNVQLVHVTEDLPQEPDDHPRLLADLATCH